MYKYLTSDSYQEDKDNSSSSTDSGSVNSATDSSVARKKREVIAEKSKHLKYDDIVKYLDPIDSDDDHVLLSRKRR